MLGSGIAMWQIFCTCCRIVVNLSVGGVVQHVRSRCPCRGSKCSGRRHYVCRLFVRLSVCESVCKSVCLCVCALLAPCLEKHWTCFRQTFSFGTFWVKDELFSVWGQRSRSHHYQGPAGGGLQRSTLCVPDMFF